MFLFVLRNSSDNHLYENCGLQPQQPAVKHAKSFVNGASELLLLLRMKGGETHLNRKYITEATPLSDYVLQVDFVSGSRLLLDMKPYLDKFRFRPLADLKTWNSAVTNGIFVRFGNVELSHDEILAMAERES